MHERQHDDACNYLNLDYACSNCGPQSIFTHICTKNCGRYTKQYFKNFKFMLKILGKMTLGCENEVHKLSKCYLTLQCIMPPNLNFNKP